MKTSRAEFDDYAKESYSAGMEDGFKRLMGETARIFLEHKSAWMIDYLRKAGFHTRDKALLDVGCGTGTFLQILREQGYAGKLDGCDVSSAMLEQSAQLFFLGQPPSFHHLKPGEALPFAEESFDFVTIVCVYHHIEPTERPAITRELFRVLKPGGNVFVFEHNPWNPATQWIVARCPIDVNAKLVTSLALASLLGQANFEEVGTKFILFFPPRLKALWTAEKYLSWLPLGGQYVTYARKPSEKPGN